MRFFGEGDGFSNDYKGMVCRTAKITTELLLGEKSAQSYFWTVPFVFSFYGQERENVNYTAFVQH